MPAEISHTSNKRIQVLDFLRGVFIFWALGQHFTLYLAGLGFPISKTNLFLCWIMAPWGEQLFLALAAFNLAKRSQEEFKSVFLTKLQIFAVLFVTFLVEGFFVSIDLGAALSWRPLMTWMFVLGLLAILYRYGGVRAVIIAFIAHWGFWLLPMADWNSAVEASIRHAFALPSFSYGAHVNLYFGSACLGFLLGYVFYQRNEARRLLWAMLLGAAAVVAFLLFGQYWPLELSEMLSKQTFVVEQFLGACFVWGCQLLLLSGALLLETRWRPIRVPLVNWWGVNSLLIFVIHRAVFLHILLTVRSYLVVAASWPIENNFFQCMLLVLSALAAAWLLKRSKLLKIVA